MAGTGSGSSSGSISGNWSQNLVDPSRYSLKCPNSMAPVGICMHNTANSAPASNEISYMRNNDSSTSFHFAVDENEAIQGLPLDRNGWHAGDGSNGPGNRKHIGIEIARSTNYNEGVFEKAERRAAAVVAKLCQQYGWGIDQVKAHRDFMAKDCPHRTNMNAFKNMVKLAMGGKLTDDTSTTDAGGGGTSAVSSDIKVGSKVKVTGTNYATGQTIPGWVKNNTYTVTQISGTKALLSDIISWVYLSDLKVEGASAPKKEEPKKEEPKKEEPKKEEPKKEEPKKEETKKSTYATGAKDPTAAEKAEYDAATSELDKYTGGKLAPSKFARLFGPVAREDNRKSAVPASVTLAQAALETGWGGSTIGEAKNLFGIKGKGPAGSVSSPTQEWEDGRFITINDTFRKYNTWMESIEDHGQFLQKDRYKAAFNYCDDPDQFAREIHKGGYATDPDYSKKLISIMKDYGFYQYNISGLHKPDASATTTPAKTDDTKPAATTPSSSNGVTVGSKVKVTGTNYATGQTVPGWVKNNTYTVTRLDGDRALLSDIISWVYTKDLAVQGGTTTKPKEPEVVPTKPATKEPEVKEEKPAATVSEYDKLLQSHSEVKTNQDLINLFYSMGGGTWDGAVAQANKYGVNLNTLCNNRSAAVSRSETTGGSSSAPAPAPEKKEEKAPATTTKYVTADVLNVREGAGTNYAKLGTLTKGSSVKVISVTGQWAKIEYNSGTAYVHTDYLSSTKPSTGGGSTGGGSTGGGSTGAISTNGVPLYCQGDSRWGSRTLGRSETIRSAGCAMCSTAMVMSKLAGREITPDQLDQYLDTHGGYSGDCIYWGVASQMIGRSYTGRAYTKAVVDDELSNGRPVVISVRSEGHWVCVAGRNADGTYIIHDPGDGKIHSGTWAGSYISVSGYSKGSCLRTWG